MSESPTKSQPSSLELKRQLQAMDDEEFEHFVADLWARRGWETEVSQKSRDKSLDVMAEKTDPYPQRHAIQAKRYQEGNRVGGPKISEYASLREYFDADASVVVATSGYTRDARERAKTLNVKLVDGDDLVEQVEQLGAHDLVEKYSRANIGNVEESGQAGERDVSVSVGSAFSLTSLPGISLKRNWAKFTAYAAGIWILSMIIISVIPSSTPNPILMTLGIGATFAWVGTAVAVPFGLYMDMKTIRRSSIPWNPRPLYYFLGLFFTWVFALVFYFYRRKKYMSAQKNTSSEDESAAQTTEVNQH